MPFLQALFDRHVVHGGAFEEVSKANICRGMEYLEKAINFACEVFPCFLPWLPCRFWSLNYRGVTVLARFKQQGDWADLEEAITWHRKALQFCPPGHPSRSLSLNNLGYAVMIRSWQQGDS